MTARFGKFVALAMALGLLLTAAGHAREVTLDEFLGLLDPARRSATFAQIEANWTAGLTAPLLEVGYLTADGEDRQRIWDLLTRQTGQRLGTDRDAWYQWLWQTAPDPRLYGVPPGDIAVLPNGYSPAEFSAARVREHRAPMRAKLGYAEGDKVVIFVANELERKGFGPLLRAAASLNDPRLRLLAVGRLDGGRYADEIRRLGLTDRVHFAGPSGDVATFYAAADLFVLPTQYEAWAWSSWKRWPAACRLSRPGWRARL